MKPISKSTWRLLALLFICPMLYTLGNMFYGIMPPNATSLASGCFFLFAVVCALNAIPESDSHSGGYMVYPAGYKPRPTAPNPPPKPKLPSGNK